MTKYEQKLDKKALKLAQEIERAQQAMEKAKSAGNTKAARNMRKIVHDLEKEAKK